MQSRSLPTRQYTWMRCDATNSYIGKSVHLLLRQTTYSECVFVIIGYPACNAHAPYCHLWPASLYNIFFPPLSHKRHDFRRKLIEHKTCVLAVYTIVFETFFVLWRIDRDMIKNVRWSSCKVPIVVDRFFKKRSSTVIPRLTKIIRSSITFVSRNVISRRFL